MSARAVARGSVWAITFAVVLTVPGIALQPTGLPSASGAGGISSGPLLSVPAPVAGRGAPTSPPVKVCDNRSLLTGPSSPPAGAVTLPAGNDSDLTASYELAPNTTYWFAPGTHTIGTGQYSQFQPDTGDTFLGAPGAILNGQGVDDSAFTTNPNVPATNVTLEYLTIENFVSGEGQGLVNHNGESFWTVEHNTIGPDEQNGSNPGGAGLFLGSNNVAEFNCLIHNGEYGFSSAGGSANITLAFNEISFNDAYGGYDRGASSIECGCSGGGKFWDTTNVTIEGNYVHNNGNVGIWVDTDNSGYRVAGNYLSDNYAEGLIYEISYNGAILNNTFLRNTLGAGPLLGGFPDAALYISESGFDARASNPFHATSFLIQGNVFTDNWGGVVLWEEPNRFCSDGSDQYCTLVDPSVYTLASCAAHLSEKSPIDYYDNCRWKTQNVSVSDNLFEYTPGDIGPECTVALYCGFNGLFSAYGNPPYSGPAIPTNITFKQNNHFFNNSYLGPWNFEAWSQGNGYNPVNFTVWRAAVTDECSTPGESSSGYCESGFGQDMGSSMGGWNGILSASASASHEAGQAPLRVSFNGTAQGGAPPYSWSWTFGDGSPAGGEENPQHTYTSSGTFAVELVVKDSAGQVAQAWTNVTVAPGSTGPSGSGPLSWSVDGVPGSVLVIAAAVFGLFGGLYLWRRGRESVPKPPPSRGVPPTDPGGMGPGGFEPPTDRL
jgi:hypothetical protein